MENNKDKWVPSCCVSVAMGGKNWKKKIQCSFERSEIVGEYFASSSLPGCGWHQENMIYSSYFVAACNSSVGVFVCRSDVMLPSSAPCKVHSCYILPFSGGNANVECKNTDCSFLVCFFSFRCRLKSTSCFFVLFFFLHLASQASRWWDDSSALLSALLTTDLCLTPDPVSHIPFVVQANPPSLFPTLPLYWPGWD